MAGMGDGELGAHRADRARRNSGLGRGGIPANRWLGLLNASAAGEGGAGKGDDLETGKENNFYEEGRSSVKIFDFLRVEFCCVAG